MPIANHILAAIVDKNKFQNDRLNCLEENKEDISTDVEFILSEVN